MRTNQAFSHLRKRIHTQNTGMEIKAATAAETVKLTSRQMLTGYEGAAVEATSDPRLPP